MLSAADRARVFQTLEEELQRINSTITPKPVRNLQISYGDEIAGLFDSPVNLYNVVDAVQQAIFEIGKIRFVAVCGYAGVVTEDIRQIGGEVFKSAGKLMSDLKRSRSFCRWSLGDTLQDRILTSLTEMSNLLLNNMTSYQYKVYCLLKSGASQVEIAAKLLKHQQSVSDAVKRGSAEEVLQAEETIRAVLLSLSQRKEVVDGH